MEGPDSQRGRRDEERTEGAGVRPGGALRRSKLEPTPDSWGHGAFHTYLFRGRRALSRSPGKETVPLHTVPTVKKRRDR